jgi:hypothetical protein
MDWIVEGATRLQMTIVFSLFLSFGDTGTAPESSRIDERLRLRETVYTTNRSRLHVQTSADNCGGSSCVAISNH